MYYFQSVINRQWVSLDWEHRAHLKTALHSYLLKNNATCPNFLRNKIAKLFVDIARHDWPHFYPEYVRNILEVSTKKQKVIYILLSMICIHVPLRVKDIRNTCFPMLI